MAHYSVSKAGLAALVRVAARELGPYGIRVNGVAPGTTDTPMFAATDALAGYRERVAARAALGRVGSAAEVAQAVVALCTLDWVTGQIVAADGGVSLASPIDPIDSLRPGPSAGQWWAGAGDPAVDAVVFDFDGLVVDTEAPVFEAWRAVFESHGCQPLTVEQWSFWIGTDTDDAEIIELLIAGASRPVDLDAMHTARRAHRDDLLEAEAVRPGSRRGSTKPTARVSAWPSRRARPTRWVLGHLERLGLRDRFSHVA